MKDLNEDRSVMIGDYIIKTGSTVRDAAKKFCVSKSTVYKDVTDRLKYIDHDRYIGVAEILLKNKSERHIRGGNATKLKYSMKKLECDVLTKNSEMI